MGKRFRETEGSRWGVRDCETGSDVTVLFLEFRFPGSGLGKGIPHFGHAQTCLGPQ